MTQVQNNVLQDVGTAGALTARRVQGTHGPRPNWYPLLTHHYLREYQTVYGPVLALDRKGQKHFTAAGLPFPRLTGPGTVVDRAYLHDALQILKDDGYAVDAHEYQLLGGQQFIKAAREGRKGTTDVIVRTVLQVPAGVAEGIARDHGYRYQVTPLASARAGEGPVTDQLGHPVLYASIRGGGITRPRLKALYRRHRFDIGHWHHPLLLAVPDPRELQTYARSLEVERAVSEAQFERWTVGFPLVRLIHVPVPGAVRCG